MAGWLERMESSLSLLLWSVGRVSGRASEKEEAGLASPFYTRRTVASGAVSPPLTFLFKFKIPDF